MTRIFYEKKMICVSMRFMSKNDLILAGDIGGTHTRLILVDTTRKKLIEKKYASANYPNLSPIVTDFLKEACANPLVAAFGLAGIVKDGICKVTNLSWIVNAKEIARENSIKKVYLLNDVEANAYGIRMLKEDEFCILNEGTEKKFGNAALISAGTGLGEAGLFWDGKTHIPFACEGGHSDFAPRNLEEDELLIYLREKFGHVSYERVVSGPGIQNLYEFLVKKKKIRPIDAVKDIPRALSEKRDQPGVGKEVMEWFVSLYGAESGNLALKMLAVSGIYLGGGIVPKILDVFKKKIFLEAFIDKGRYREFLTNIPVKVILNEDTALIGAVEYALLGIR